MISGHLHMTQCGAPSSASPSLLQEWHDLPQPQYVVSLNCTSSEPLKVSLDGLAMHEIEQHAWSASAGNQYSALQWSSDDAGMYSGAKCDHMPPQCSLFRCGKSKKKVHSQSGQQWQKAPGPELQKHLEVHVQGTTQTPVSPASTPADHNAMPLKKTDVVWERPSDFVTTACSVPPLVRLAERGNQASVRKLLEQGEDPSIKDDIGVTALHAAAKKGYKEIVDLLLHRRAHVNVQATGWQSESPLHYASKYGRTEVVQKLLANKADPNLLSKDGHPALHYAQEKQHNKIVHMLVQAMN